MMKPVKMVLALAVLVAVVVPAFGQGPVSLQRRAKNKLLAQRAARVDAIRKLAERIKGLSITSSTSVKDFVTEDDRIATDLRTSLSGMKEISVKYLDDGICEVTMQIKLSQVIATLKGSYSRYYKGNKLKVRDIEQISTRNKITILTATGSGAPREELEEDILVITPVGATNASLSGAGPAARAFWAANCTGRGRLMAERAARIDAMRKLSERINGLRINSQTRVQDFVAESDDIRTRMNAYLRGVKEVGRRYHKDELIVEVEVQIKLRQFYMSLKSWTKVSANSNRIKIKHLEEAIIRAKDTVIRETGMGVPPEKYLKRTATIEIRQDVRINTGPNRPGWVTQTLRATGNGAIDENETNAAKAKLMAYRAAELDARRKLGERINGLAITANTTVRDFVAENDEIDTSMMTFQQGARVLDSSRKVSPDGTAEVTVEIDMKPLWQSIMYYRRELKIRLK